MTIMKSVILSSLLLVTSTNALADIQTSDTRDFNWMSGEPRGYHIKGTISNTLKKNDFHINVKSGGVFIPRSLNGARTMNYNELITTKNKSESLRHFN